MGKLLCEATTTQPWRDPQPTVDPTTTANSSWDDVAGLEDQQRKTLARVHAKGVLWKHPEDSTTYPPIIFQLNHGGEVDADGNCLFSAACIASASGCDPKELRKRTVKRFEKDFSEGSEEEKEKVEKIIKNMYHPDLTNGWGIHVVQDVKLLANKSDRCHFDLAITQLVNLGMQRESAAESIYKERCIAVNNGPSWAKYMSVSGSPDDEYDIITLQYTEEGLLTVDENREGHAAAFGDDIAIECLATEFEREIFVVQAHGSDAMVDEDHCVFFLPHRPRCQITRPPIFLFMKGTGWCGAGADHYEPLIANPCPLLSQEKVAFVL